MNAKIVLGVLIVFALVGAVYVVKPDFFPLSQGFSTLSIGTTDLTSNDPEGFFNGKAFVFSVRQGGLAQSASGSIAASNIQSDGAQATKGFKLELVNATQSCDYPIQVDYAGDKVYLYGWFEYPYVLIPPSVDQIKSACAKFGEPMSWGKVSQSFVYGCVYRNARTSYSGRLKETANYAFKTDWTFTIDSSAPLTASMSSAEQSKIMFSNIAYGIWQGNLVTGDSCPSPVAQRVIALYKEDSAWNLIDESTWDDYKNKESNLLGVSYSSMSNITNGIASTNVSGDSVLRTKSFSSAGGASASALGTLSSGHAKINLEKSLQFPVFTFYVKAQSLGIFTPETKPVIISTSGVKFKTGETGTVEVSVKNDSTVGGIFTAWLTCDGSIRQSGSNIEAYLNAGQIKSIFIPVTGSCSTNTTSACMVHVMGTTQQVSKTVSVSCSPQCVCEPDQTVCMADVIKKCKAECSGYEIISDCASKGQVCGRDVLGNLTCTTPAPVGGGSGSGGFDWGAILFGVGIILVLLIVLGLVGLFIWSKISH